MVASLASNLAQPAADTLAQDIIVDDLPQAQTPPLGTPADSTPDATSETVPAPPTPELSADVMASLITQVSQTGPTFVSRSPKQARSGTVKKKKKKDDTLKPNPDAVPEDLASTDQTCETQVADDTQSTHDRPATIQTGGDQTLVDTSEPVESSTQPPSAQSLDKPAVSPSATLLKTTTPCVPASFAGPPPTEADPIGKPSKTSKPISGASKQSGAQPKKPKKRNKFFGLLLPCFISTAHEDEPVPPTRPTPQLSAVPAVQVTQPIPNDATAVTASSIGRTPSKRTPVETAKHLRNKIKKTAQGVTPTRSSRRTGSDAAQPIPVSDTVTPAGAAAATSAANAGGGGVQLPADETEGVLSGAVVPPGKEGLPKKSPSSSRLLARNQSNADSLGKVHTPDTDEDSLGDDDGEDDLEDSEDDEEDRIVAMGGMGIPVGEDGIPKPLLAPLDPVHQGRKCLVLDLDETLVHSSFKMIPQSDFVVPVEIENAVHNVYVIKRPGVDEFMRKMGEMYEVVVFTASLSKYADPVLDMLDIHRVVKHRLFRESCHNHKGNYVKDLSQLGRPIGDTIIIDNSPASYIFHPSNAVPVSSWFNDPHDTELADLAAFLADIADVPDVRGILDPRL